MKHDNTELVARHAGGREDTVVLFFNESLLLDERISTIVMRGIDNEYTERLPDKTNNMFETVHFKGGTLICHSLNIDIWQAIQAHQRCHDDMNSR